MAEITKVGPERCLMHRPELGTPQHKWMCKMAHGSERILILIQAGWKIVEDDRNHVVNDYGGNPTPPQAQMNGHTPVKIETQQGVRIKGKRHKNRKR